jgi:hypothetical protein
MFDKKQRSLRGAVNTPTFGCYPAVGFSEPVVGDLRNITQGHPCLSIRAQGCSEADTADTDEARFQWY